LLAGLFDYAGLFPPASQRLEAALASYAGYRSGADAWMLGRLVVPAAHLPDVSRHTTDLSTDHDVQAWRLSAILGQDAAADRTLVEAFNRRHATGRGDAAAIDTIELTARTPDDLSTARGWVSRGFEVYCEVPVGDDLDASLDAIARAGLHAKLRTGGSGPDSVPTPPVVADFLCGCVARGVAAKATAGLHHAMTGHHAVSSRHGASPPPMLGFVNVVLAAGIANGAGRAAAGRAEVRAAVSHLLSAESAPAWVGDDHVAWHDAHGQVIEGSLDEVAASGRALIRSIGTCSFEEPVAEARRIGLLS